MEKFGFVLHPLSAIDLARKFPITQNLPERLIERILKYVPPFQISHITGIATPFNEAEGWFVACPLTSLQMLELPESYVINKIIKTGKIAEKLGAKILGLGAFTSVVGDAGITIAKNLDIPVTTGNSYTVAIAIEGAKEAARRMDLELKSAHVLILGATGSIGAACAQILSKEVRFLTLAARNEKKLEKIAGQIYASSGLSVKISSQIKSAIAAADLIIAVTSALDCVIEAEDLKPGAIICDVSRPRNVSKAVAEKRNDVLVIEGGIVEVPGDVDFNFNFGFSKKNAYACMAETMILALEGRYESFTLGRNLTVKQIQLINSLAQKHGFKLAGLRSFEKEITDQDIGTIKSNVIKGRCIRQDVG